MRICNIYGLSGQVVPLDKITVEFKTVVNLNIDLNFFIKINKILIDVNFDLFSIQSSSNFSNCGFSILSKIEF